MVVLELNLPRVEGCSQTGHNSIIDFPLLLNGDILVKPPIDFESSLGISRRIICRVRCDAKEASAMFEVEADVGRHALQQICTGSLVQEPGAKDYVEWATFEPLGLRAVSHMESNRSIWIDGFRASDHALRDVNANNPGGTPLYKLMRILSAAARKVEYACAFDVRLDGLVHIVALQCRSRQLAKLSIRINDGVVLCRHYDVRRRSNSECNKFGRGEGEQVIQTF